MAQRNTQNGQIFPVSDNRVQDCDLLPRERNLRDGERAMCSRCGAVLYRKKRDSLDDTLNFSLMGLIFRGMGS